MIDLSNKELLKAFYIAINLTYFEEIVKATPGKGAVRDKWTLNIENGSVVIENKAFDMIIGFLEFGTGLYGPNKRAIIIEPKNKKALRWNTGPGDRFAFAKRVINPGIKARRFIQKVLDDPVISTQFEKELKDQLMIRLKINF